MKLSIITIIRKETTMLFKGIERTFSTENSCQFETIGAFWDELAAKYGRVNMQGLGCRGPNDNKPEFCSERCGIILCEKRKSNGYSFCDECTDFPCADVVEKETRYGSQYPLRESPLENLRFIREAGIAAFLEREQKKWTCPACRR